MSELATVTGVVDGRAAAPVGDDLVGGKWRWVG